MLPCCLLRGYDREAIQTMLCRGLSLQRSIAQMGERGKLQKAEGGRQKAVVND